MAVEMAMAIIPHNPLMNNPIDMPFPICRPPFAVRPLLFADYPRSSRFLRMDTSPRERPQALNSTYTQLRIDMTPQQLNNSTYSRNPLDSSHLPSPLLFSNSKPPTAAIVWVGIVWGGIYIYGYNYEYEFNGFKVSYLIVF